MDHRLECGGDVDQLARRDRERRAAFDRIGKRFLKRA
jgi:hypothetical protein